MIWEFSQPAAPTLTGGPSVHPNHHVAPADAQLRLLTKVARLYHERGVRQAEIAASLNISQAKVSRLLKRAAALGIVRTTVMIAPGLHTELEERLEERYGLAEAVVVDVDPDGDERDTTSAIGAAAATHLEASLAGKERVGISSWSQTLLATVDRMRPVPSRAATEVVQLLGGIGVPEVQSQAYRLVDEFARVLGASAVYVQAPGIVEDRVMRERLMLDPSLAEVSRRWRELTVAVVGIGSIEPSDLLAESGNAYSAAERAALLADGAVGDICHRVFRLDGSAILGDLDDRTISIPVDEFRAIPRRIGVAGGPRKLDPIRGALAGRWVTSLVTDRVTAEALLEVAAESPDGQLADELA